MGMSVTRVLPDLLVIAGGSVPDAGVRRTLIPVGVETMLTLVILTDASVGVCEITDSAKGWVDLSFPAAGNSCAHAGEPRLRQAIALIVQIIYLVFIANLDNDSHS